MAQNESSSPRTVGAAESAPAGATARPPITLMPRAVLDNLASRVRPSGFCVMAVGPKFAFEESGDNLFYIDPQAGLFFQRFVAPLVQYADGTAPSKKLREEAAKIDAGSGVSVWSCIPGVLVAAFPYVEKRQLAGIFLLAAKSETFAADAEIAPLCEKLGLDGQWLTQQAEQLPSRDSEVMARQGRLLLTMVRDQLRLSNFQTELDSLSNQLANTYEELSLIYQVSSGMRINRRAGDFFKQACLDVLDVMGVRGMGVALHGEHAARQQPVVYGQLSLPPGTVHRLAEELMPILCLRNTPLLINDLNKEPQFAWLKGHVSKILAVPMQRQDEVLGCYFAMDKLEGEFDSQDLKLLNSIANESAIYLENAMLYDDVHGLMMGLLHSLTSAVDAKDAYTHGHSERVAAVGRQLTLEAGLGEALAERVYLAGLLHDVGKIGVPESVLHKTGRLTPDEFEQMKKHPQIGARILADVKQVRDLIPGVLHHHERYDGNGYPHGLAGANIPLMGRLICLADCFDAMTSNRTYRKALPLEVALTEIRRCSGTQFDPGLTEAFLRIGAAKLRELVLPSQKMSGAPGAGILTALGAPPPGQAAA
ncbi:MAG: HD domain-containing phosphohydrolase [Tepidisphaeraceae bacterium]|jgi:HD-GYP domain-containing protein (c-di-GMP phosphodiesterase class II)